MKEFPLAFTITKRSFTPLRCIREGTTEAVKLKFPWAVAVKQTCWAAKNIFSKGSYELPIFRENHNAIVIQIAHEDFIGEVIHFISMKSL